MAVYTQFFETAWGQCKVNIIPQRYLEEIIKKNTNCSNSYTTYVKIKLVIN